VPPDVRLKCTKFDFHWGSLQRSPGPLAVFHGPTSKVRDGVREGNGRRRKGK